MADKKISELGAIPSVVDADLAAVVDDTDATTKKATGLQLKDYIAPTPLPIARGGTNSTASLSNDRVMISSSGEVVESSTVSVSELDLLNGKASVSTGITDNDKLVTQGYVDDAAFGTLWTTVGNVGSGAQYNSIDDAIVAGKYDLAIIGNFNETKDITVGANSVHIKITDTCNMGTKRIIMNSTGDLTIESGKLTCAYTAPLQIISNAGSGTIHMSDLITDATASSAVAAIAVGNAGNRMHISNCRCFLSNTISSGFLNAYNSSSITDTTFIGGGATCTGAIINLAGGIASNLTFEGTFVNLGEIITFQNEPSILNGVMYNATNRSTIALYIDANQVDNLHGDLEIDLRDTSKNQISNCYISDIDLSDSSAGRNKFVNIHNITVNITIAGTLNQFVNFESDADITIDGGANWFSHTRAVNIVVNGNSNEAIICSFTTYTDNGNFNNYISSITKTVDVSSSDLQLPTAKAVYDAILAGDKVAVPSGPTDTGTTGQWAYGSGYEYRCVATDTWIRKVVTTTW